MASNIVKHDIQGLIDGWIEAEQNGERFPVPFDLAWTIAGYKQKQHAKRRLTGKTSPLKEGKDYLSRSGQSTPLGRSSDSIKLTCDAFKHFCLMAQTDEGEKIRDYFIEAEKKWKLVQKYAPQVASEIEIIHARAELARIEAQKEQAIAQQKQADLQLFQFRHFVTSLPEPVQQKILGYSTVEKIEYRDRVIHNDDVIRDGSTISKTEMCRRLGFVTRSGSPDYKRLNRFLVSAQLPGDAWKLTVAMKENEELRVEHWEELERKWLDSDRNFYLGE